MNLKTNAKGISKRNTRKKTLKELRRLKVVKASEEELIPCVEWIKPKEMCTKGRLGISVERNKDASTDGLHREAVESPLKGFKK